jgi:hypothetical protein
MYVLVKEAQSILYYVFLAKHDHAYIYYQEVRSVTRYVFLDSHDHVWAL